MYLPLHPEHPTCSVNLGYIFMCFVDQYRVDMAFKSYRVLYMEMVKVSEAQCQITRGGREVHFSVMFKKCA